MTQTQSEDNSLFRIMIATDNHLGYLENDQIRGDDSFVSFEEILKVSKYENVDFLLLGGDLFHHHNPTKKTIIRASNILQKHVYGQKEHKFDVFCYEPNFKNENLSIELPIFIIHGNHDDPSGFENFSSIDIFSNREVNYFGKVNNYEEFDLYPILFTKGNTKIALYGIGNIKDERLYLALQNKKVNFHRPEDYKNWFNILIVHQNRFKGHHTGKNKKNYLPESFIPSFFDLVIWGHEHEAFLEPVYNSEVGFHVYQPGSSVVTSLIQAESKAKHIGILEVSLDRFRIVPAKLESVRPFIFHQMELKNYAYRINRQEDVEKIIEEKIEEMLIEAKLSMVKEEEKENYLAELNNGNNQQDNNSFTTRNLPILRIKIEFSGYQITRTNFIVSKFAGRIANPGEVIQFYKKGDVFGVKKSKAGNNDDMDVERPHDCHDDLEDEMHEDDELRKFINQNISSYYVDNPNKKNYFNSEFFCDALEKSVNGQERRSLELLFKNFNDYSFHSAKIDSKADYIKDLKPLENPKKDFSHLMDDLINKDEVNNMILNNIKSKKNLRNSYENNLGMTNHNQNNILQNITHSNIQPNNQNIKVQEKTNTRTNANIKLMKANDFIGEKRDAKNILMSDNDNLSQSSRTTLQKNSQKVNYKKPVSILDFIKKSSETYESAQDTKEDKFFHEGLDKIEEISEEMFAKDKKKDNQKKKNNKNFLIVDEKKNLNKNKKFTK